MANARTRPTRAATGLGDGACGGASALPLAGALPYTGAVVDAAARGARASAVALQIRHGINGCADALRVAAARLQRFAAGGSEAATLQQSIEMSREAAASMDACLRALHRVLSRLEEDDRMRTLLAAELHSARTDLRRTVAEMRGRRAREADAQYAALHDSLTGLPNRRHFKDRSGRTLVEHGAGHRCFALMFIDLDGFKAINDTHGHAVGDALLKAVGARLDRALRAEDMISRHGGDEFVCVLQDVDGDACVEALAHKLFDAVAAPYRLHDRVLSVAPSIGIALFPRDGSTLDALLAHADEAMFHAKQHRLGIRFHRPAQLPPPA